MISSRSRQSFPYKGKNTSLLSEVREDLVAMIKAEPLFDQPLFEPWINEPATAVTRDIWDNLWDDSRIRAGENWDTEIRTAIDNASVAVLLVSKNFLPPTSSRDRNPRLLDRADRNQIRLVWIAIGYSGVQATRLWKFQAVNDPSEPLESLGRAERKRAMADVAVRIADAVTMGTLAGGLRIIDETRNLLRRLWSMLSLREQCGRCGGRLCLGA